VHQSVKIFYENQKRNSLLSANIDRVKQGVLSSDRAMFVFAVLPAVRKTKTIHLMTPAMFSPQAFSQASPEPAPSSPIYGMYYDPGNSSD
jgi:hypothetical protein